jgi:hypothetical protein
LALGPISINAALAICFEQIGAAVAGKGNFLDIIMPNGKRLADCTGNYVERLASTGKIKKV